MIRSSALVVSALLLGCSSSSSGGGAGGAGGAASSSGAGASTSSASVGGSSTGTGGGAGNAGGAGGSGGGALPGQYEKCKDGACAPGLVCDYPYHACTNRKGPQCDPFLGECTAFCPSSETDPVCGCDGVAYENACAAHAAGVDIGDEACGPEVTPKDHFPCGTQYCDPSTSYCWVGLGDTCDIYYECKPLEAGCPTDGTADCSCACTSATCSCVMVPGNGVTGIRLEIVLI